MGRKGENAKIKTLKRAKREKGESARARRQIKKGRTTEVQPQEKKKKGA